MSSEADQKEEMPARDFNREERRLARLRLVVDIARSEQEDPAAKPPVREADQWRRSGGSTQRSSAKRTSGGGSGEPGGSPEGSGRFPQLPTGAPDPKEAA